jgi:hypothetical protein
MSVTLRHVHHGLVRALGMDPETANFTPQELDRHVDVINHRVRMGYEAEFWPLEMVVEEKEFESGAAKVVLFEEDGVRQIGMVDLNACAYEEDPDEEEAIPVRGVKFVTGGIRLPSTAADEVWIRYRPPAPVFSLIPWDAGAQYQEGDLAYVPGTGDTYVALADSENERPEDNATVWSRQTFPDFLYNYVKAGSHADMTGEDIAKAQSDALAERELERLRDLFVEQSGSMRQIRYRR